MHAFILNTAGPVSCAISVVGFVQHPEAATIHQLDSLIVAEASDLEVLSSAQLTDLYNKITGESKSVFKTAKSQSAVKVFAALNSIDISTLVQLDKVEEAKVEKQSDAVAVVAAIEGRKVRDSKLQRMKTAFLSKDEDGKYKPWTVKELMEACGKENDPMSERITHVYISILRSPTDRFVMNIVKDKDSGTFVFAPEPEATATATAATPSDQQPQS